MLHTEERIVLDDGVQTTLERWGDRGPAVVCIHGMTSSRRSWEPFAQRYAGRYRVYAYDQRGHGDSAGVSGPMTLHRSLLDLYNVIEAIGDHIELLAGHSWGGAIAILGGRRFDAKRVVAIDPMIRQMDDAWYDAFLGDFKKLLKRKGEARAEIVRQTYVDWPAADREHKIHAVQHMTTSPIKRLRDENPPENWDLRRELEDYPKPLFLALADAKDSLVALEDLKDIRSRGGSNVVMRVFEGRDHNLHRTAFDDFARELDIFLERTA